MTDRRGPGGSSPDPAIRARVLDAFVDLLSTNGLSKTSMSDVARAAGVSKTTLYTRWPDRRSLIVDGFAHISAAVPAVDPDGDFDEMVEAVLDLIAETDLQHRRRQVYAELLAAAGLDDGVRAIATQNREEWRRTIEALILRGQQVGRIPADRDIEVAAEVVMAVVLVRQLQALPLGTPLRTLFRRLLTDPTPY